jgi:hypothetical protein
VSRPAASPGGRSRRAAPDPLDETIAEHGRLRAAVDTMTAMLAFPPRHGSALWRATILERLDALQSALGEHFDAEERRRLFESIEEANPASAAECRRFRNEHRSLLAELRVLGLELAAVGRNEAPRGHWVDRMRRFLTSLGEHEQAENALLLDAVERQDPAAD